MKKEFVKKVIKLVGNLSEVDGFFYYLPVGHFLYGFILDKRPNSFQIYGYTMPVFDRLPSITLSFAVRLPAPDCFIDRRIISASELSDEFIKRISHHQETISGWATFEGFLQHIHSLQALNNPWVKRAYAMTLIMLNRDHEAYSHLTELLERSGLQNYPNFENDVSIIADILKSGGNAKTILLEWEAETKIRWGIEAVRKADIATD